MKRRVPIVLAIAMVILGVLAGKAWATLESGPADTTLPATMGAGVSPSPVPIPVQEPESTTTTTTVPPLESQVWPSVAYWETIHVCEQPDSWIIAGRFGNGLAGGGGLGISNGAWWENGGRDYAELPGQASPVEQMIVASRILQRYGPGAWGCRA